VVFSFQLFYVIPTFLLILGVFPETVEHYYSNGLYGYVSHFSRRILGCLPFSVGDIIYGILIVYCIYWFYKKRKQHWKYKFWSAMSFLSVFYFLFHLLWAYNYYRVPLFEKMNIERDYTNEDLYAFTKKIIIKTNEIQYQITHDKNQKVSNPYSLDSIFTMTQNGYDNLANQYPFFKYEIPSRKKSIFSLPLTYMGFGGYLNPFTNESQVNYKLPKYGFPNVVCHEMAHQIGYASESECNFIGFLACIKNKDLYFQYAAYATALRYCLENLIMKDETKFKQLKPLLNKGILKNFKESEFFWEQYDTFIDKGFYLFYDQFLKSNQQKDGIESYSKFVNLLINYYKEKDLK
jgi:hypothetical protein